VDVSLATEEKPATVPKRASRLSQLTLRCLIYKSTAGVYIAECVDLDIIVKGPNQEIACKKLLSAVSGYMKVALSGADPSGLVPRHSPLSHRLRYHWYALRAAVQKAHRSFRLWDLPSDGNCDALASQ
jgi:hypothetical protein